MNLFRWLLALIMYRFQCLGLVNRRFGGRRVDWDPIVCEECNWRGPVRWCIHTYRGCLEDDVEPVDECPGCGSRI